MKASAEAPPRWDVYGSDRPAKLARPNLTLEGLWDVEIEQAVRGGFNGGNRGGPNFSGHCRQGGGLDMQGISLIEFGQGPAEHRRIFSRV